MAEGNRKARVLVVDDDEDCRFLLARALQHEGYSVVLAATGRGALQMIRTAQPDAVVLDLMLPDLPGLDIARVLKSDSKTLSTPIIILSARSSEADRVLGLEIGADDYVVKPFSLRELVLRVGIALRRTREAPPAELEAADIRIEPNAHRAFVGGEAIALTPIEFGLLSALLGRRDQVQSREALLADVWGAAPDLATRTVDTHIKRLRLKLGPSAECIETVRGVGYRFRTRATSD